jgi:dTDP-4-amino-4,6-dideoxygalactose transaminase
MSRNIDIIPFAKPEIGPEEEAAVIRVLRSGWLTTGPETHQFEQEFAAYVQVPHALAVNSATAGLHLSLEALGIKPGDRVITTPYTFTASAEVIRYLGAEPVFADIEADTYNIDPGQVEKLIIQERRRTGKNPAAILPVHIAGLPCNTEPIFQMAAEYAIPIVEDAAHAFPVKYNGEKYRDKFAGTAATCGVYSFYANKTITTGEGGMVVTNRADL